MSITIRTRFIVYAVITVIIASFVFGGIIGRRRADRASQAQISLQNATISRLTLTINSQKVYITEKEQEILTLKQAKEKGDVTNEALRKLNIKTLNELTKANLRIDTLLTNISHNGQVIVIHDTVTINNGQKCILLPFSFSKADKWLTLGGNFDTEGKLNVALKMKLDVSVYTGVSKETKRPFCVVTTDNPYTGVIDISSIKLDVPKVKKWGIGVSAGYGVSIAKKPMMFPYIGFGISRNIIRF
jgi:hypothetical protein